MVFASSSMVRGMVTNVRIRNYGRLSHSGITPSFCQTQPTRTRTVLNTLVRPKTIITEENLDAGTHSLEQKPWKTLFELELPEGRCLGLQINKDQESLLEPDSPFLQDCLHPAEVEYGSIQSSDYTRQAYYLGRLAMRQLIQDGKNCAPIMKDAHGRPSVPPGYLGSISHKRSFDHLRTTGVALIAPFSTKMGVGVDIEYASTKRTSIAKRVLTERERTDLGHIEGVTSEEEVLLRFSIKESLYKAVHPLICQYVGFQEAEVVPHTNGTATCTWDIKSGAHSNIGKTTAHWQRVGEFFLTSGSVTLQEASD